MGYGERSLAKDPAWYAKHHDRVLNMYMRTANYPCVNILSLGNEAGDGINFDKTYDILKDFERDGQNRPVVYERAKGGRNTDFLNPMYPDAAWLRNQGLLPSEKPVVLCEYSHAMGNSNGSFDYMWDEFYKFTNLQGGFVWDWMDQGIAAVDAKGKSSGSMAVTMAIRKKTPRVGGKTAISAATAWLTRTFLFIRAPGR